MVNQNLFKMKQPQLGKKILEWRKAKGLTQEDLVELCQINVRTIQRIESGEVTPRPYTLKTIMEALDVNATEIKMESNAAPDSTGSLQNSANIQRMAFYIGIVYFITAFVEVFMDFMIWEDSSNIISGIWYTIVKLIIVVTFTIFKFGFYKIGKEENNPLINVTSILLIAGVILSVGKDLYLYFGEREFFVEFMMADALYFGSVYILFSIGLIRFQKTFGAIALVAGCVGIIAGLAIVSIIFAIPGMFLITLFEIMLLVILERSSRKSGRMPLIEPQMS